MKGTKFEHRTLGKAERQLKRSRKNLEKVRKKLKPEEDRLDWRTLRRLEVEIECLRKQVTEGINASLVRQMEGE